MEKSDLQPMSPAAARARTQSLEAFMTSHKGLVLRPTDEGFEQAREIWNKMIDRQPALIALCHDAADIQLSLEFAKRHKMPFSIRGGGHGIAGNALCDDGLMINLSRMREVRVNPKTRIAHVQPGATLAEFDHAAQLQGLATPLGINSTTGVAGLTLGGGFGWLTRKFGLTVDNLVSVDIITADGNLRHANEKMNSDLFWAVRGGGSNFGIVTNFEFRLHPVGPEVFSGMIVFPYSQVRSVLQQYRDYVPQMPDELSVWAVVRKAPPLPFLPPETHGKEMLALALCYTGDEEEGLKLIEPIKRFGNPIGQFLGMQPYTNWQKTFDPLLTFGARNYWKSHNFADLGDEAINVVVDFASRLPSDQTEIFIGSVGGEAARHPIESTAYPHRDPKYVMNVHGRWLQPSQDAAGVKWCRDFFKTMAPFSTGGVYVNFLAQDDNERIHAAYGRNYTRRAEIKAKYDPENLFRVNQNIPPTSAATTH